jgi:hypothetical protein
MAPFKGRVACPILAMREMMLALQVFGLLVRASDMDAPRALMLVSSVLQQVVCIYSYTQERKSVSGL